jgi:threonine dehydrogenase-like Zn-dependent dehydrogenase
MRGTSRNIVAVGPGKIEMQKVPLPELNPQDMLGKVVMSGICGTDVHMLYDETPGKRYPFGLGHEVIATIVEMGPDAPKVDAFGVPLKVGDRVAALGPRCGECYECRVLNQPMLCTGRGIGRHSRQTPRLGGGYADYVYIRGDALITRVPDSLSTKVAVLTEPLAGAVRAIERAYLPGVPDREQGFGPGKIVVVQGSGPVGALIAATAKIAGAYKVIVTGAPDERLELCKELGADVAFNFMETTAEERAEAIRALTPHGVGADVVIEAAGAPSAFVEAIDLVRQGGIIIEHGHFTPRGTIPFDPTPIVLKDIQILGNRGYNGFGTAMRILEANADRLPLEKAVTHEFPLSQAAEALEIARKQEGMKIVFNPALDDRG